ncbi:MAG: hypothetical protein AB1696_15580 [Planctomycetota bacterium]
MSKDFKRFLVLCIFVGAPFAYCQYRGIPIKQAIGLERATVERDCIKADLGLEFETEEKQVGRVTRQSHKVYLVGTITNVSNTETVSKVVVQVDFALGENYTQMQPSVLRGCRTEFVFGPIAPRGEIEVDELVGPRPAPTQPLHHRAYVKRVE